jgi:hypothetical protein
MIISTYLKNSNKCEFKKFMEYIKSHTATICKSQVSHRYVLTHSLKHSDGILVGMNVSSKTRSLTPFLKIEGFVIFQLQPNALYVDVICARKAGKVLLSNAYKFAKDMGKKYIVLNALPHVVNFYKSEGFVHAEYKCSANAEIQSSSDKVSHLRFKSPKQALQHKEFKILLQKLVKNKLVSDKACKGISECSLNGFVMTKCL